jgi:tetratricopeptide (TPR) repeat protein
MDTVAKIKSFIKEANLYQSQGLLNEARLRYENAEALIHDSDVLPNKPMLLEGISKKLQSLEVAENKIERGAAPSEISAKDKDLIKKVFSSSKSDDQDKVQLEGAVALAKFGQFDRAIIEFEELIKVPSVRLIAAKHILRCHIALRSLHDPVSQYERWETNETFPAEQLEKVRIFLESTYGTSASQPMLPSNSSAQQQATPEESSRDATEKTSETPDYDPYEDDYVDILDALDITNKDSKGGEPVSEGDYVDVLKPKKKKTLRYEDIERDTTGEDYTDYISSIGIQMVDGANKGKITDLSVNLQTGKDINLIVSSKEREIIKLLKKGAHLKGVKLNSPISVDTGNCTVVTVARIDQGPKKGDYSVDLRIEL